MTSKLGFMRTWLGLDVGVDEEEEEDVDCVEVGAAV